MPSARVETPRCPISRTCIQLTTCETVHCSRGMLRCRMRTRSRSCGLASPMVPPSASAGCSSRFLPSPWRSRVSRALPWGRRASPSRTAGKEDERAHWSTLGKSASRETPTLAISFSEANCNRCDPLMLLSLTTSSKVVAPWSTIQFNTSAVFQFSTAEPLLSTPPLSDSSSLLPKCSLARTRSLTAWPPVDDLGTSSIAVRLMVGSIAWTSRAGC
mmetsp:Transcript_23259/g.32133  ORF Transcript_23259/g.32133 Transcript_23259/m.32133 type:complete len:216 (-) Transcript_23259:1448-2095(-)